MPRARSDSAFLNIPYDRSYEDRFLAYIAGLAAFGVTPRATLELTGATRRLDRILGLIASCRYSFHDLSMVKLDRSAPQTPRFNMPFELGLVVGWQHAISSSHAWFVFESSHFRLQKSLSDLNGTDPFVYGGSPEGVLREIRNSLARQAHQPTAAQMHSIYQELKDAATGFRKKTGANSHFEARVFAELALAAQKLAELTIPSLQRS